MGGRPAARESQACQEPESRQGTKARISHRLLLLDGCDSPQPAIPTASQEPGSLAGPPTEASPCSIHPRLVAGSEERGHLPSQARPVSRCRAGPCCPWPPSIDGGGPMGGGKGVCYRTPLCSVSAASSRGQVFGRGPARAYTVEEEEDLARLGVLAMESAAGGWRYLAALVPCPCAHWRSSCEQRPGQGRYLTTWSMLQAAWCVVLSSALESELRAGGPVLNRPLTNLCIFFHSLFLFPILLLPEQISSSPPPSFPLFLPPSATSHSLSRTVPSNRPPVETPLSRFREKRGKEEI